MKLVLLTVVLLILSLLVKMPTGLASVDPSVDPGVGPGVDPGLASELPPGERYRQLSLVLLLAGEIDPALIHTMAPDTGASETPSSEIGGLELLERYSEPLWRIANPDAMLTGAAQLFRYARENQVEIRAELYRIESANPILISMVDVSDLVEEAIIIRSAIADSIQYLDRPAEPDTESYLKKFRAETVHLRNMMEFRLFAQDLDMITDDAILDLSGKLDAYQRMVDEDVDLEIVRQRIAAAESMNEETRKQFAERSRMRTSELLMMLIPILAY